MKMKTVLVNMLAVALFAGIGHAQTNATLTGTVVDTSNAVSPGTVVTATDNSTGQQYSATSDARGVYRIVDMQPGTYNVQATRTGFAPLLLTNVQLLVGQTVTLPLSLKLQSVSQAVEVQAEAELVNTENQQVGGNINRTQMDDIPLLGRNVQDLSMLVAGVTSNDTANNSFGAYRDDLFQVNLDNQQITQQISTAGGFGEPFMSRDAVAEFQIVTNQYDITQGRSEGEQVNVITRSGTNNLHGTAYANFRRDAFDASDFVSHTVLPFSQSIAGGTVGGPVIKDKLHYFLSYEHQSQPQTVFVAPAVFSTLPSGQNSLNLSTPITQYTVLARGDYNINEKNTLTIRGTFWNNHDIQCSCQQSYPTSETAVHTYNPNVLGTWTNILTPNIVQQVQAGYSEYYWKTALGPGIAGTPYLDFLTLGLTVGPSFFYPENFNERTPSIHYNISIHQGKHDIKFGAETLLRTDAGYWPSDSRGWLFLGTPTDIPFTTRFPLADYNNPSAWNETNLGAFTTLAMQNFYPTGAGINMPRHEYAVWAGDTWHPLKNLSITLGLRWDADTGEYDPPGFTPTTAIVNNGWGINGNIGIKTGYKTLDDWAPRGGISYTIGNGWVIRGGAGVFYAFHDSQLTLGLDQQGGENKFANTYINFTGSPSFFTNWTNGATAATYAANPSLAGPQAITSVASDFRDPRALQATLGLQKQVGTGWVITSDLIYTRGEFLAWSPDANQNYDPNTGYSYNPNYTGKPTPAPRPDPAYAGISLLESNLHSELVELASSVNRRFARHWQTGLTYTLMFKNDDDGSGSGLGFSSISTINNQACPSCEWGRSPAFQRNTLRLNAIYNGPLGLNLSGVFYYGSGNYFADGFAPPQSYIDTLTGSFLGTNRLNAGTTAIVIPSQYAGRWDGPLVIQPGQSLPRDAFHGLPLYKLDLRLSKDIRFHERFVLTPMVDVFNLFNHPNYGSYNLLVNIPNFGAPAQNLNDAYVPREFQFAFHFAF
jgi:hypothetical protein